MQMRIRNSNLSKNSRAQLSTFLDTLPGWAETKAITSDPIQDRMGSRPGNVTASWSGAYLSFGASSQNLSPLSRGEHGGRQKWLSAHNQICCTRSTALQQSFPLS